MSIENAVSIMIAFAGFFTVMFWVWRDMRGNTR